MLLFSTKFHLEIATALAIATSNPVTEASCYIQCAPVLTTSSLSKLLVKSGPNFIAVQTVSLQRALSPAFLKSIKSKLEGIPCCFHIRKGFLALS